MSKMIIYESESLRSVESYLKSNSVRDQLRLEFGDRFYEQPSEDIVSFIRKLVESETDFILEKAMVSVLHCDEDAIDIVDTNHQVIRFNGKYFDYTAQKYNDSFDNKILDANVPVVQTIIYNNDQVRPTASTIKYYVMLGETK